MLPAIPRLGAVSLDFMHHFCVIAVSVCLLLFGCSCNGAVPSSSTTPFEVEIRLSPSGAPSAVRAATNVVVDVIFKNNSTNAVRVLDYFEPLPIFFSWDIREKGKAPLSLPGAGKISIPRREYKYLTIPPKGTHSLKVSLSEFLREHRLSFQSGTYTISTSYRNQYGEECVQGIFPSNKIELVVGQES